MKPLFSVSIRHSQCQLKGFHYEHGWMNENEENTREELATFFLLHLLSKILTYTLCSIRLGIEFLSRIYQMKCNTAIHALSTVFKFQLKNKRLHAFNFHSVCLDYFDFPFFFFSLTTEFDSVAYTGHTAIQDSN